MQKRVLISCMFGGLLVLTLAAISLRYWGQRRTLPVEYAGAMHSPVRSLCQLHVTVDQKNVVAGNAQGDVVIWDLNSRSARKLDPLLGQPVVTLAESDDGLLIASGLQGRLRAWQSPEFNAVKLLSPEVAVTAIAFRNTPDGRSILMGLADGRIATVTGSKLALRKSGHRGIKSLLLVENQDVLVSVGTEGQIIWFDLKTQRRLAALQGHQTEISALIEINKGTQFATADWNGVLQIWSTQQRQRVANAQQPDAICSLKSLGNDLITASWDGVLRRWKYEANALTLDRSIDTGRALHGLDVIESEAMAVTVSNDASVEFWSLKN